MKNPAHLAGVERPTLEGDERSSSKTKSSSSRTTTRVCETEVAGLAVKEAGHPAGGTATRKVVSHRAVAGVVKRTARKATL